MSIEQLEAEEEQAFRDYQTCAKHAEELRQKFVEANRRLMNSKREIANEETTHDHRTWTR